MTAHLAKNGKRSKEEGKGAGMRNHTFFVVGRVKGRGGRKSETRRNYGGQCTLTAETQ